MEWLIADTHFFHDKFQDASTDDRLWGGLAMIPQQDILFHLGDISIGHELETHLRIRRFPYKKVLVRGNHDKKSNTWYLEHGWDFVCYRFEDKYFGLKITFSHIPVDITEGINIHGHLHADGHRAEEMTSLGNHLLYAPEAYGLAPVPLKVLLKKYL